MTEHGDCGLREGLPGAFTREHRHRGGLGVPVIEGKPPDTVGHLQGFSIYVSYLDMRVIPFGQLDDGYIFAAENMVNESGWQFGPFMNASIFDRRKYEVQVTFNVNSAGLLGSGVLVYSDVSPTTPRYLIWQGECGRLGNVQWGC